MRARHKDSKSGFGLEPRDQAGIYPQSTTVIAARYWVSADAGHLTVAIDAQEREWRTSRRFL
jgi:hypothetical protein